MTLNPASLPVRPQRLRHTALNVAIWLGVYVVAVTMPLFALLPGAAPARGGFRWDFAVALGYAGLAMAGVQFALTARFRRATAPFGIDIVYYFHRFLAIAALTILAAHWLLLKLWYPGALGSADPGVAPPGMTAGRVSLFLFALLVLLSLVRRRLNWNYDHWRVLHALMATLALALALGHLLGTGRYLDSVWKQALWAAYGAVWIGLIGYVRVLRPRRLARAPWRVAAVRPEHGRVWTLVLEPPAGVQLAFAPGQFAWLSLRSSPFSMREHPFSIASSAERRDQVELSIKELGDFTSTIKSVRPGETAWLDAPYGSFSIDWHVTAQGYVFVAGGIGIAPILSMLRTMADRGDRRQLTLFYGNRVWERVAFREELEVLGRRLSMRVIHALLEPPPEWMGERGFITQEMLARHLSTVALERAQCEYFLCGPTPMTTGVERALTALGVPGTHIHSEIFDWV
jgi:predicted ferric reductase